MTAGNAFKTWRLRVLIATWLSYVGFYFCRKNFAIAKTSILQSMSISTSALAHLSTVYLIAYMIGQLSTSYLSRHVSTRRLLLGGMAISGLVNVALGSCYLAGPSGYWPMMALMAINGLSQASGWPANVGVLSNWLKRDERGRAVAVWATCYQIGSILAKTFAALMLGLAGAAWSFWGAALVMAAIWIVFYLFERDRPEDVGLPAIESEQSEGAEQAASPTDQEQSGWDRQLIATIAIMGACYFVFKFLRYSLDSWGPLAIERLFGVSKDGAGYISTAFDWVGFLGVLLAGWVSDRRFHARRYQTILLMTIGMFGAFVFLALLGVKSVWLFGIGLAACGLMLMGPDSLLSGVGAIDVAGRRGATAAAGLINGLGSIGPIFQEELLGVIIERYGMQASLLTLIAVAAIGIGGTLHLARRCRRGLANL